MRTALLALLLLSGCGETQALDARISTLRSITEKARVRGAYRCAPEELALSDAHLEFAREELALGDVARARHHLVLARVNASAAVRLSADTDCARAQQPAAAPEVRRTSSPSENSAQRALRRGSSRDNAAI